MVISGNKNTVEKSSHSCSYKISKTSGTSREVLAMYVCICNDITEKQIIDAVFSGCASMADIRRQLGVASGCGGCVLGVEAVMNRALEERGCKERSSVVRVPAIPAGSCRL